LSRLLDRAPSRERSLALAMIVQRVLEPGSKLACTRQLSQLTLAEELALLLRGPHVPARPARLLA
jgi:hypothetical protein